MGAGNLLDPKRDVFKLDTDDRGWMKLGNCNDLRDASSFFPERGESHGPAKSICRACEVREECLEYALRHHENFGIWGGKSVRERRTIARTRRPGSLRVA